MIKYLSEDENFEKVIKEGEFLVDFYASWCGPCKMISPILETLENINVIKIDVDKFSDVAKNYGVMSIPTLIYFKDGKEVRKEIGFRNKEQLENMTK